jgi:hypothetical protein
MKWILMIEPLPWQLLKTIPMKLKLELEKRARKKRKLFNLQFVRHHGLPFLGKLFLVY